MSVLGTTSIMIMALSLFLGVLAIYVFNRVPSKWICEKNAPTDGIHGFVRVKMFPWSIVCAFVMFFFSFLTYILYGVHDPVYFIWALSALFLLLELCISDLKYMIIPDECLIGLVLLGIFNIIYNLDFKMLLFSLAAAAIGGGTCYTLDYVFTKIFKEEAIGFGDTKLFAALGFLLGIKGILAVMFISLVGSGVLGIILIVSGLYHRTTHIPLGPFISLGGALYISAKDILFWLLEIYRLLVGI